MTARPPFTKARVRKAIEVAEEKGYHVAGITADGTILVYSGDERPAELSIAPNPTKDAEVDTWADR